MVSWKLFQGSEEEWNELLVNQSFYSIYQSYQWGEIKKGDGWQVARVVKEESGNVSQAQILYRKLPLKIGFFWCPGGVMGKEINVQFSDFLKELGLCFYYFRCSFHDSSLTREEILKIGLKECSFKLNSNLSMNVDLSLPAEELLRKMSSNWRHNSKRGKKKNPIVEVWPKPSPDELFQFYKDFESMKKLSQQHSYQSIQGVLEKFGKNVVILKSVNEEGQLLALRGFVYIGKKALDWFAISTNLGRKCYSSYIVMWMLLEKAKECGVEEYDLSGVDPVNNSGVYNFKKGAGGELVEYPGEFECSSFSLLNIFINILMKYKLKQV
jgi:lipid II:glycine glycyltransferase (peptidoglycan interpeptide bridge formation enzyme)